MGWFCRLCFTSSSSKIGNKHKVHTSCDALEIYCKLTEAPAETQLRLSLALNVGSKIIHNPEIQGPKSFGFKTIQA